MGREAEAQISYLGATGGGKLLLEGNEILCRGDIRARIPRSDISRSQIVGEYLILTTPQGPLTATLGAKEAAAWVKALAKPVPTLAEKLGIGVASLAFVVGEIADPVLEPVVAPFRTRTIAQARLAVAELRSGTDLTGAVARIGALPLWAITVKGRSSPFAEAQMRPLLRAMGYVDTKSCAVSDMMTATRWQKRGG